MTAELLAQLEVPTAHHPALLKCADEDGLLDAEVPADVRLRLLDALFPTTVEEVLQQPDLVPPSDDAITRFANGEIDLKDFLLRLDPEQERAVDWGTKGPLLVKGGPGVGKSVTLLYRVRTLLNQARQEERPPPRVLLTTYTNALCRFSYQLLARLLPPADLRQVTIQTADKLACTIARRHGQLPGRIADEKLLRDIVADVRQRAAVGEGRKVPMPPDRLRDAYLLDEFAWVIEGRGVTNLKTYLEADRAGRGIRLTAKDRDAVWNLYKAYRKRLEQENVVSWGQVRGRASNLVRQGKHAVRFDSVLVDEAQDLTPMALGLLVQLCASPEGVCLTADANQSVYARGFTWKDVNERLNFQGRTVLLKRNYRTTREIVAAASSLLTAGGGGDVEALPLDSVRAGRSRPILQPYGDIEEMASLTAAYLRSCSLRGRLAVSAAAVLTPTHQMGKAVAEALTRLGVPARYMPSNELDLDADAVKVMTLHSAKGLEFPTVVVTGLAEGVLPRWPLHATPEERQEVEQQARRLAFVGMTRAMHNLLVLYSASSPSSLLKNLDESNWEQAPLAPPPAEAAPSPVAAGP